MHIVRNDTVEVLAGNYRGKAGKVLSVMPKKGQIIVEGVNYVWRHIRPSPKNPQGGRIQKEAPINASKVLVICQNKDCKRNGKGVRTRNKLGEGATKIRVCVKCDKPIAAPVER
ncbi:MAG TPA: 50S ribosomal protein L24 [Candidatus Hypogeohydataceae bacterium YC41]